MSLAKTQAVINGLRARGITVHEWPGWQTRGTGQTTDFVGGIVHHTATAFGMAPQILVSGRSDLAGPLCNFAGNVDGSITVIAAGSANHAGASGGRSMGPLPVTTSFNRRTMGLEIVYPGTVPMKPAQYHAALVWARVVADVCGGGNIECIRAHAETSVTGKWDPGYANGRTIDMAAFRRDAINPTAGKEPEVELTDKIRFWDGREVEVKTTLAEGWQNTYDILSVVRELSTKVNQLAADVAALKARPAVDVDEAALAAELAARGVGGVTAAQLIDILATVRLTPGG